MEAALARHYDFLKDVLRTPPVGPIAHALGAMKEKAAAPLLASHLLDPADTEDDIKQTAAALAVLAGAGEVPALREFFGMYRATAEDDDMAAAVVNIGQALAATGDKAGRAPDRGRRGRSDDRSLRARSPGSLAERRPRPRAGSPEEGEIVARAEAHRDRPYGVAPSMIPSSSSRDERQHSLPAGNVLHASGRMG